MVDRVEFTKLEELKLKVRRLKPVELLGIEQNFRSSDNPVGIFGLVNNKLLAIVEFDDFFDLNGNRFYND